MNKFTMTPADVAARRKAATAAFIDRLDHLVAAVGTPANRAVAKKRIAARASYDTETGGLAALHDVVVEAARYLDPQRQGPQWPDPIAWDGRPLDEQARDLCVLLDQHKDDPEAAALSSALWAMVA